MFCIAAQKNYKESIKLKLIKLRNDINLLNYIGKDF